MPPHPLYRWLFAILWLPMFSLWAVRPVQAEGNPLVVEFTSALQALNKTLDPRDDQQWNNMSRFLVNPDLKWIIRFSFLKERTRGIYNHLYSQCTSQGSHGADMLQIIEAGRLNDAGEIHVLVSPPILAELQRTLKTPKNVTTLFRSAKDKSSAAVLVTYNDN